MARTHTFVLAVLQDSHPCCDAPLVDTRWSAREGRGTGAVKGEAVARRAGHVAIEVDNGGVIAAGDADRVSANRWPRCDRATVADHPQDVVRDKVAANAGAHNVTRAVLDDANGCDVEGVVAETGPICR